MAHFARIDDDNVVRDVIVIDNKDCGGGTFPASEPIGQAFITGPHPHCLALAGNWLQTSYSGSFRGIFANVGDTWDGTNFVPPAVPDAP